LKIEIIKKQQSGLAKIDFNNLQFGDTFSDHMITMDYHDQCWKTPTIKPYGAFELFPGNCYLHYGQAVFEGLKAFKTPNGKINIFRPDAHYQRLNNSSQRLCIPKMDYDTFIKPLTQLLQIDSAWIPDKKGCSLYIRPVIFATDNFIGVKISDTYTYFVITSPVGAYYKGGLMPTRLTTSGEHVRTIKGILGEAKTPANYAASLLPQEIAKKNGFSQVLWLDGIEKQYIDEVGTANVFFLIGDELITPPLDGSILAGITRDSIITLAKDWGITVCERRISIDEVFESAKQNTLKEIFSTGTAVVISPVGEIEHNGKSIVINNNEIGHLSQRLYDEITAIQYGEKEDRFGWCLTI